MFNVSRIRKEAAPRGAPAKAPAQAPEADPQKQAPSMGASPMSGWVDLKKAHKDIGDLLKNPAGKEVEVKSVSKAGVHTFTITVKPTDMMQRAEQNGGVQQPTGQGVPQGPEEAAPASNVVPGPGSTDLQAQEKQRAAAAADKKNVKTATFNLKDEYPAEFLKTIGL